ncbi:MAG: Asp/Glu racemase [Pseudomonadota bacterium]
MTDHRRSLLEPSLPAMGLIVLRVDETIEQEFRDLIPPDRARLHVTRVQSGDALTPETIANMEAQLTEAAALLPAAADFDVVAYACTSGTAFLTAERVAALVRAGVPTRAVTNPLTASVAHCHHLGLRRIGLVSPYVASVADTVAKAFEANGIAVVENLCFGESDEATVARIDPHYTANAARRLANHADIDGIFLSCTNLKTIAILDALSQELGIPVLSSNHSLAWHMEQLALGTRKFQAFG